MGNIRLLHGALEQFGREAFLMWMVGSHYRKPVAYSEDTLADAAGAVARVRELVRRLDSDAGPAAELDALAERFFDHLADDFNTAAARAVLFDWVARGQPAPGRRASASGPAGWLRCSPRSASRASSSSTTTRLRMRSAGCRPSASRRAPSAISSAPTALRDELADQGWEIRDTPERRTARAARMIVYGRNPVREALRGKRRVHRVYATARAAREVWLGGVEVVEAEAFQIEERCGSPEHQGLCAEAEAYPYVEADGLLSSEDALVLCLDEVQDPHNLGATCRVAEVAGCSGVVLPERRSAEVTPAVCRASAGAVEHLAVARVKNLADWLAIAKERQAWIYGAAADGRVAYDRPDYRGRVVLVLGSEGKGLRPRVASACDELIFLPSPGRVGSLNVSTAAAALVYGILHLRSRS